MSKFSNFYDDVKQTIKDRTIFTDFYNSISNADGVKKIYNNLSKYRLFIGLLETNNKYMQMNLYRNIGEGVGEFDGYGTPIGSACDKMLNYYNGRPWYLNDADKVNSSNYIDYIKKVYETSSALNTNFFLTSRDKNISENNSAIVDDSVGVVREYVIQNCAKPFNNGYTTYSTDKNRGGRDTRLGYLNDFYLNRALLNSISKYETTFNNNHINYLKRFIGKKSKIDINNPFNKSENVNHDKTMFFDTKVEKLTNSFELGNSNIVSSHQLYTYAEPDGNRYDTPDKIKNNSVTYNPGINLGNYKSYKDDELSKDDIIKYTNKLFTNHQIDTLIGRFHSDEYESQFEANLKKEFTSTAISKYGMSRGRNLLRKNHDKQDEDDYSNPYCRVWTFHHQYSNLSDTIRPFYDDNGEPLDLKTTDVFSYRTKEGIDKLKMYGVKGDNGLIRIAPTDKDKVKRCMFSIENLAWKDERKFFENRKDQKGPLGGRIMWFPPYDLKFDESVSVNWSQNQFIGRGENIYTYTNTERSGSLSFKLLIDHPSIANSYKKDINNFESSEVDDVESKEQSILRFFAGCDIMGSQRKERQVKPEEKEVKKEEVKEKPSPVSVTPIENDEKKIIFFTFFPNNYSGVDDEKLESMSYLINGIVANKYVLSSEYKLDKSDMASLNQIKSFRDYTMGHLENGKNNDFNGYEMSSEAENKGISHQLNKNNCLVTHGESNFTLYQCKNKTNGYNYWGYRVDKEYEKQILSKLENYLDNASFGLNSSGYENLRKIHKGISDEEMKNIYSFENVFYAVQKNYTIPEGMDDKDKDIVNKLRKYLKDYKINKITGEGYASSHGYKNSNDKLAKNRCNSVLGWLRKSLNLDAEKVEPLKSNIGDELLVKDINTIGAKSWRCVKTCIYLKKETTNELQDTNANSESINSGNTNNPRIDDHLSDKQEPRLSAKEGEANPVSLNDAVVNHITYFPDGYGEEYKFFEDLKNSDPFLHNKITEKIRYFDPAFHSITPEGFQSRLTFLHQCTRQGDTNSKVDLTSDFTNASNLAFGRPPICVLRIGDFYNTKILIDNLSISYDDASWDLNDEGIGVMPMMADIRISFKFLGGSDLSGPINRLQNALSFNHYGNTSVYDDRAENIEYNDNGEISNFKTIR